MIRDPGNFTQRLLVDAGLGAGQRVLDVGCGSGDVCFLAARTVGAHGTVVGIDRNAAVLDVARARALELGLSNVSFLPSELSALPGEHGAFDLAVGRRVLMYQADSVEAVRTLMRAVRPGGVVVFQEHDATMTPASRTPLPLHEKAVDWAWRTVEAEGGTRHMGFDLATVLHAAGLVVEHVRAEATVQTPGSAHELGTVIRAMLPRIVQHGVATAAEVNVETLDARLDEERERTNTTFVTDVVFGAWARKPA